MSNDNITVGQHVLIRLPSNGLKIVQIQDSGIIGLGKFGHFEVSNIHGYPLGTSFEIIGDNGVRVIKSLTDQTNNVNQEIEESEEVQKTVLTQMFSNSAENNQNIIDIGSKIQSLTKEDVDELKKSGASSDIGQLIIDKMIAGHEGFDKKTIFSQQKYLKRKQQKFLRRFTVEPLTSSNLLEYYVDKDPSKMLNLSVDTLGLIMTYGNVRPGGNYLVIDETGGVLVYAMLERMNQQGSIIVLHENEHANLVALKYLKASEENLNKVVRPVNWLQFAEPENEKIDWKDEDTTVMKPKYVEHYLRKKQKAANINTVLDMVVKGNFDGFISMSTLYIPDVLEYIIPKIGGSRPIVIYNQYKELLAEVQQLFTNDRRVLASSILETRVRPYQTIPGRMHPIMTMKSLGGYVLWGTKVIPDDSVQALGKGVKRKREDSEQPIEPQVETNSVAVKIET
ncbi:TRM6 [Candida pseudojiufengensis]|uniref:TRM6 n=1 Tax=Candida pseudojiufengensis TaxID=497109 RepID=UPI002223F7C2|nr:TRM6 [Candida pseudojiufengensis]KAI5962439.1 TRM6 [Candida pseudojiufengensis]